MQKPIENIQRSPVHDKEYMGSIHSLLKSWLSSMTNIVLVSSFPLKQLIPH